jgi:mannose-1-phosphate guanylyltransferase
MKAMILAAGLGTRLRPLTLVRPKVLVPVMGSSILDFWVRRLAEAGCEGVVVNAFHVHERLVEEVRKARWEIPVDVRVEPLLLGTGGGVRNVLDFFGDEPFVVINGDIVCDFPIRELYEQHLRSDALVSLLLHDCEAFNNVAVKGEGAIMGFGNEAYAMEREDAEVSLRAFTGVHFIHPRVLRDLQPGEYADILPVYRDLIREFRPPQVLFVPNLFWREMGSVEAYWTLSIELASLPEGFLPPLETGRRVWKGAGVHISGSARLDGIVAVGNGSHVGDGCTLENVILWDGVFVAPGSKLHNCIVADGVRVEGSHEDELLIGEGR